MINNTICAQKFGKSVYAGAANLKKHVKEINDLNVFPIPDGDTGDNMLLTMIGGTSVLNDSFTSMAKISEAISNGMLMGARGNSGVILSQFFDGISKGFENIEEANVFDFANAFKNGVKKAYQSVSDPKEGTMLTVMREATEYASSVNNKTIIEFLESFIKEAKESLSRTPSLLPVLKEAGVVDSGGAGIIYIVDGMKQSLEGKEFSDEVLDLSSNDEIDYDLFTEDSELEFGYCTELLVRLQNSKVDIDSFDVNSVIFDLEKIGNSIVIVKNGSVLKVHVHTMTPYIVLQQLQLYGEFLKVKIENMSLQHNNVIKENNDLVLNVEKENTKKKIGIISVASGDGIKAAFLDSGVDVIVDGGQSMNPSTEDFIHAFDSVNAENIFVFPNNSNIILTAKQAKDIYSKSNIYIIETHNIGEGYAALSMYDPTFEDMDDLQNTFIEAMLQSKTIEVTKCIRNANIQGHNVEEGEYISIANKDVLSNDNEIFKCIEDALSQVDVPFFNVILLIKGKDADLEEANKVSDMITNKYPNVDVIYIDGMQNIYNYIIVLQ